MPKQKGPRKPRLNIKLTPRRRVMLARQGYLCPICKKSLVDGKKLDVDHIRPKSKGGSNTLGNCQVVHASCNRIKGDTWDGVSGLSKLDVLDMGEGYRRRPIGGHKNFRFNPYIG